MASHSTYSLGNVYPYCAGSFLEPYATSRAFCCGFPGQLFNPEGEGNVSLRNVGKLLGLYSVTSTRCPSSLDPVQWVCFHCWNYGDTYELLPWWYGHAKYDGCYVAYSVLCLVSVQCVNTTDCWASKLMYLTWRTIAAEMLQQNMGPMCTYMCVCVCVCWIRKAKQNP